MNTQHTISVLVENQSGSLSRIAGLFSSRGYNITSLSVAETDDPTISRMTIVAAGDEEILEQIVKHLNRLIDVIKVMDFRTDPVVERELLLIRISAKPDVRHEIKSLADVFGGKIVAMSPSSVTVQLVADAKHIGEFIAIIKPYGLKELVRSGKVALARATK